MCSLPKITYLPELDKAALILKGMIIHNDFMYPAELDFIAENRLRAANYRHRLTLLTRCNPAIEIGDYLRLQSTDASTPEEFVVIGQKIVFDKDGLTSEMELAGYKE